MKNHMVKNGNAEFRMKRAGMATVSALAMLAVAGTAVAQEGDDASDAEAENNRFLQLGTVTVTAQKREEGIQDVPLSITAPTGEQLERLNATNVSDLEFFAPGLMWGEGASNQWPTIRGVDTQANTVNVDPALGFFINGTYKSRSGHAISSMVDVERVEVLRGPQGTLFGRNTTSGAVNVITRAPTDEFEYRLSTTAGNYSRLEASGMVNIPVSDKFQVRLAGIGKQRDGYVENVGPGPDLNDENLFYGRASFALDISDNIDAVARVARLQRDRVGGGAFTYKILGQMYDTNLGGRSVFGDPVFINPRVNDGIADTVGGASVGDIGVPIDLDPYVVQTDFTDYREETEATDVDFEINFDLGGMTLKSITAYSDFSSLPFNDNDFTDLTSIRNRSGHRSAEAETLTQEFQLASAGEGPLEWVLGAFYMQDETFEEFHIFDENGGVGPFPNRDGDLTGFVFRRLSNVDTDSWAVFGQATYNLTEQLSVTGGLRYTSDTKDFKLRELGWLGALGFNPDLDTEKSFEKLTWRLGAEYDINDDNLLYAAVSTGFRSGGFNRFADAGAVDADTFDSEELTAYEIGSKSTFAGGRANLNLAAYFSQLENQQVSTVVSVAGTGQAGFSNAGESEFYGFEAELQAQPTDEWFVLGTLAYNNSEYLEFLSAGFAADTLGVPGVIAHPETGTAVIDLAGNESPRSPNWQITAMTGYDFDLGPGRGRITPILSTSYTGNFYSTQFNTPLLEQDSFTKTDFRLVYSSEDDRFSLEGFVKNIEDEAVISRGTYGGSNAAFVSYGAPQTWGIRLTINN